MLAYPIHTISSKSEIKKCPQFHVNHYQWTCKCTPKVTGRLAYIDQVGFLIQMECVETDPKRIYTKPQDPVYLDSAMEAFFSFTIAQPDSQSMYLNFEINANGAMLAKYGAGRKNRQPLSPEEYQACECRAYLLDGLWGIEFLVPLPLIEKLYDVSAFHSGDHLYCNFYKISESPEIEHYASYRMITSDTPNFHIPSCFAEAVLV